MVAWHCRSSWWIHSKSWDIHRYTYISMYYYYYLEMLCVSCKLCVFTSTGPCYVGRNYTGPVVCCHWPWSPELPAPAWTVDAPVCTCRHRGQVSFLPYLFYYLIIIQGYCYWVKANSTGKSWQNTVGIRPSDLCLLQIKAAQIFLRFNIDLKCLWMDFNLTESNSFYSFWSYLWICLPTFPHQLSKADWTAGGDGQSLHNKKQTQYT